MKFSIRSLLALIVLAALVANAWQLSHHLRQADLQIGQLRQTEQDRRFRLSDFDRRKVLYERFFDAQRLRGEQFAKAEAAFQQLARKYGYSPELAGDQFMIVTVPTYDTNEHAEKCHRIHVPDQTELELRIEFVDGDDRPLVSSTVFEPRSSATIALPPGESVILFRWPRQSESPGVVELNGEQVFAFQYQQPVSGYSASAFGVSGPHRSRLDRPLRLLSFTPSDLDEGIRLSIARRAGRGAP
jgi:hypothetical protein